MADDDIAAPPPSKVLDHPLGVYFSLDDAAYHADVALGSGDLRRLAVSPFDFWWESRFCPDRKPEEPTRALIFGRAAHTAVLEGIDKFREMYAPLDYSGSTTRGKAERERIASMGMIGLSRDDYERVAIAASLIRLNPYMADAFNGGAPEVSVFWEADGIKKKARLDFLKPRATTDLKSIRNTLDIDFRDACRRRFVHSRLDAQAAHYNEGRAQIAGFLREGKVFGDAPRDLLDAVARAGDEFAFVFVFWQADGAPLTWGMQISPGNPVLARGQAVIDAAIANWKRFVAEFGTDAAWVIAEPPAEVYEHELPYRYKDL